MPQRTVDELRLKQALPLSVKVKMTKRRIKEFYDRFDGQVYVSFSGGKDSTVLKHIVDSMYDDVPSVFVNTGLEYPEIQSFVRKQDNVTIIRPKMQFDEVVSKYGYPVTSKDVAHKIYFARLGKEWAKKFAEGTAKYNGEKSKYCIPKRFAGLLDADFQISKQCCDVMKKAPAHKYERETGRHPIIATMAEESKLREQSWLKNGCNAFESKSPKSNPMSFWTEQDVLRYIKDNEIEIASVYGDIVPVDDAGNQYYSTLTEQKLRTTGCNRTGCIFCMFGVRLEDEPNRFQRLKATHPRQYEYCINGGAYDDDGMWKPTKDGLGLGRVLDEIGVKY